ncbi:von_Willebrand factor type A domain-containing protein [Hexamita inflata]|uniref:von Willebrand factor type A domain-containing protein n=1 Tax=Hexamita inflata TaxID=28002 RepID=A0AA86Q7E0_9EUKA|nr:von Willebrand factor type A domain-containing protein [Hexamita inflata]
MHISVTNEGEKPGKVSFFVSTDGEENSSRQFSKEQVQKMVTKATEDEKLEFIFAGANIDAFAAGQALGFQAKILQTLKMMEQAKEPCIKRWPVNKAVKLQWPATHNKFIMKILKR